MSEEFTPETEPSGSLVPPIKVPPTAIATSASPPPPPRPAFPRIRAPERMTIGAFVEKVLDTLDSVGDSIARVAGLRQTPSRQ